MARIIALGGRYFVPTEQTSARQDGWVVVQLADAGLGKFAGKTIDEEVSREIILQALRSGKTWHLLAGFLVERGEKWTPAKAEENAEFFAELTDAESKAVIDAAFLELLAGFFLNARVSLTPSPNVSETTTGPNPTPPSSDEPSIEPSAPAPAASGGSALEN